MQQNTNKQGIHPIKCTEFVNAIFLRSDTPMKFSFTCHEIYLFLYLCLGMQVLIILGHWVDLKSCSDEL